MKWFPYFLLILLLPYCFNLTGQNTKDSLLDIFHNEKVDSSRITALHTFVKSNYNTPDSAIKYAQFAVQFSKEIKDDYWLAKSYNLLAVAYYYQGDLIQSKKHLKQALTNFLKVKNKPGMAIAYNGLGVVNYDQGKLYDALEFFVKSLRIKQKTTDTASIAMTLNNIGNVYKDLEKFDKSMEYYQKSIELKETVDDKVGVAMTLNNIGLLHHNFRHYELAQNFYQKSLNIKREINDLHGEAMTLNNIGLNYELQEEYERALEYYNQSVDIREKIGDQFGLAMNHINIGTIYRKTGNYSNCFKELFKAEEIAKEIGATTQLRDCYQRLYETYEMQGNTKSAYSYYKKYIATKDSMMSEESIKNIQKLQAKYESEKQQLLIQNLSNEKELNLAQIAKNTAELSNKRILTWSLGLGLLLCGGLIIFFYFNTKQRAQKSRELKKSLDEKEVLIKEVHHRVKNNFQLISSLLNLHANNTENEAVQEALSEAKDRIGSMALVHEKLYKSTDLSMIMLNEYLSDLSSYLLENTESGVDVESTIDVVSLPMAIEKTIPLGLIFNELITNSLKYAFNGSEDNLISIKVTSFGNQLEVEYRDNGIGLPPDFDQDNLETLGLNLVQILVLQLHGKLEILNENGAVYRFKFEYT